MSKSDKYSVPTEKKIVLLVYSTHFGFNLSESVLALLQYWCVRERHKFERILLFAPDPKIVQTIFPLKLGRLLEVLDAEQYADNKVLNLHPKKWKTVRGKKLYGKTDNAGGGLPSRETAQAGVKNTAGSLSLLSGVSPESSAESAESAESADSRGHPAGSCF